MSQDLWDVSALKPVSKAAAQAYREKLRGLTEAVDQNLTECPNIAQLLGKNPLQVMYTNHSNHALFIAGVLQLNDFQLLSNLLPWVYRSYHARGFDYAYFPLELKAWKKALFSLLKPALSAEILPVYDWMLNAHESLITAAESPTESPALGLSPQRQEQVKQLLIYLLKGDRKACQNWLATLQREQSLSLSEMYLELLQPTMQQVGLLWEEGKISVAQEHLASALVSRLMVSIYGSQEPDTTASRGKVLITTAPNEFHEMGAWMLSDLLEEDGWETRYLGANTPFKDILDYLEQEKPDILAISVAIPFNIDQADQLIRQIRSQKQFSQLRIMLGGQAFSFHDRLWETLGADGYASNAREAVKLAAQWQEA
jgi:methanogenic corrinoid protein MtbC1